MNRIYLFIHIFILALSVNTIAAQKTLTQGAEITLLSCDSGEELYSTFGHTAIRVKDLSQGIDYAFHYGLFNFSDPDFYTKFLQGFLIYSMGVQKMENFLRQYDYQERTVYEQSLNLTHEQKENIYNFLVENYKPENRNYEYQFFFNNCATIVRDIFENQIEGFQLPQSTEKEISFREMLDTHLMNQPWADFGIDLIIGSMADRKATISEQFFLPMYVHDHLSNSFVKNESFVSKDVIIIDHVVKRNTPKNRLFTPFNLFFILMVLELIFLGAYFLSWKKGTTIIKVYDQIWFLLLGLGSLVLSFMWWGTEHDTTNNNWNLVWMNPLFLLVFLFNWRDKAKWLFWLVLLLFAIQVLSLTGLLESLQNINTTSYLLIAISTLKLGRYLLKKKTKVDTTTASTV